MTMELIVILLYVEWLRFLRCTVCGFKTTLCLSKVSKDSLWRERCCLLHGWAHSFAI